MCKTEACALRAERTISFYATVEACDPKSSLVDLLTDMRHYCNDDGLDFDYFVRISKMNFEAAAIEEKVAKLAA